MENRTRIKICGITRKEDGEKAVSLGADALGFIFYAKSPRNVTARQVKEMTKGLPPFLTKVGVFVELERKKLCDTMREAGLNVAQLHGDEPASYCEEIPYPFIKSIRVKDRESLAVMEEFSPNAFLFDSYSRKEYGGSGLLFDWDLVRMGNRKAPLILAGGLKPENVFEAVRSVEPYGVDVSSGVEDSPGKKNWNKIERFIEEVRRADSASR